MTTRRPFPSIREQIMRRCRHFNGVQNKACSLGIAYPKGAAFATLPCFAGDGRLPCGHRAFPTEAEAEAEAAHQDEVFANVGKARRTIKATGQPSGRIDCPICQRPEGLAFSVSSYNGHIHAACATKGCVSWME